MLRLTTVVLSLGLFAVPATSASAQKVKLAIKRSPSSRMTVKSEERMSQVLTLAGNRQENGVESFSEIDVTTGPLGADGTLKETHAVKRMQTNLSLPGGISLEFDSQNPDGVKVPPIPGGDSIVKAMKLAATIKRIYVFDKGGKLARVELGNADEAGSLDGLLQSEFDPDRLKQVRADELAVLPTDAVAKGATWQRSTETDLGGGQMLSVNTNYTYEGLQEKNGRKLHKIGVVVTSVDLKIAQSSALPFTIKNTNLKSEGSVGELWFDADAGVIAHHIQKIHIKGTLEFEAGGQQIPAELDLTMEENSTVTPQG